MKQKRFPGRVMLRGVMLSALALAVCPFFRAAPALAHSVYIFAWAEQERLCSESYFGRKSKVRQGRVTVYGADGEVLATVRTDDEGLACFPAPEKAGDLLFEVNAGQGHRATFLLPAADLEESTGQAEDRQAPTGQAEERSLQRKKFLEANAPDGPGWRDVVGGLGWIVGIAGLAAWFTGRKGRS